MMRNLRVFHHGCESNTASSLNYERKSITLRGMMVWHVRLLCLLQSLIYLPLLARLRDDCYKLHFNRDAFIRGM